MDRTYLIIDGRISIIDFLVDLVMFKIFLSLYFYFFAQRKMKLSLQNEMMTNCNKAIFCWGLFLTLLTFAHSLVSFLDKLIIKNDMQSVELQIQRFYFLIKDFLVYSTILYLFYFQAIKLRRN
jgi:hypothetical protein